MTKYKLKSIINMAVVIVISLTIIFNIGKYNGKKDRQLITPGYVDYINICTWKKDIIGCMYQLQEAEKLPFNID